MTPPAACPNCGAKRTRFKAYDVAEYKCGTDLRWFVGMEFDTPGWVFNVSCKSNPLAQRKADFRRGARVGRTRVGLTRGLALARIGSARFERS